MYTVPSVGLEEAQETIQAMIAEIRNHPEKYWQYACMAIVDERGKLVSYAKMNGAPMLAQDMSIRKAWTAVMAGRDKHELNERLKVRDWVLQDFITGGTPVPGGVAIVDPNEGSNDGELEFSGRPNFKVSCCGGIGVSAGGPYQYDLDIAQVGLKYIQSKLWP